MDEAYKTAFYATYKFIFNRKEFDFPKQFRLFSALIANEPWAWRVIGITKSALDQLRVSHYANWNGIQRAHLTNRMQKARNTFFSKVIVPKESFFEKLCTDDETVLALKTENRGIANNRTIIRFVNPRLGLFQSQARGFTFNHSEQECAYLKTLP